MSAQLRWQTACELGFRGNLAEWEPVDACGDEAINNALSWRSLAPFCSASPGLVIQALACMRR